MKGIGGHHRGYQGKSNCWLTPPEIIRALGQFSLDPCCPPSMPWRTADNMIEPPQDGLKERWRGRVFLNAPYGPPKVITPWVKKLAEHGDGITILFARTETEMFHRWVWEKADALLFLRGRLHFYTVKGERAKANAGGPSVLVAYGIQNANLLSVCGIKGQLVRLER